MDRVALHDAELAGYTTDLPLWADLTRGLNVVEFGAGTGRVLAALSQEGTRAGVESDPELARALWDRVPHALVVQGDMREVNAPRADMVFMADATLQLFPQRERRRIYAAARSTAPRFAAAVQTSIQSFEGAAPVAATITRNGLTYASYATGVVPVGDHFDVMRTFEARDAAGVLVEVEQTVTSLWEMTPADVAAESGMKLDNVYALPDSEKANLVIGVFS